MAIETIYDEETISNTLDRCYGALKQNAFNPKESRGRRRKLDRDRILFCHMDPYQLDTWKIKNSKMHRRTKHKTQVIPLAKNAHIRTRLDHEDEVAENAKLMATVLGLNTTLVESTATGHDDGHTPFGHIGEVVLTQLGGKNLRHEKHGVFVAQHIERKGKGLNLTYETLLGIASHSRNGGSLRQEESMLDEIALVMYADKLSYLFSDYNDVKRHGLLPDNFRYRSIEELGRNQTERCQTVMAAIIDESARKGRVVFSEGEVYERFEDARQFMWKNVYEMIDWNLHKKQLQDTYQIVKKIYSEEPKVDPVVFMSLMTDRDVTELMQRRENLECITENTLRQTSAGEILPSMYNKTYNYWDLDLDWAKEPKEKDKTDMPPGGMTYAEAHAAVCVRAA
ncbi:HD domain-containing protein [Candidatus Woesearchaeota archaeon]|nr:HD domain-containing protein [Candidatus Woesearchaeota archaeon]